MSTGNFDLEKSLGIEFEATSNKAATSNRESNASRSSYLMAGAVGGMFTGEIIIR